MKKTLMYVLGIGLIAGSLWAAGVGPFQFDDQGAYIAGTIQDGNGSGLPSATTAYIEFAIPRAVGQEIWCNNCTSFDVGAGGMPCISTSTKSGGYMAVSSATAVSVCK